MRADALQLEADRREDGWRERERKRVRGAAPLVPGQAAQEIARAEIEASTGEAGEVAALRRELARKTAELESLRRARNPSFDKEPSIPAGGVFSFDTPHGAIAKRESKHLHLTTTQLTAAIAAGSAEHPGRSVLCRDGWWTPADD